MKNQFSLVVLTGLLATIVGACGNNSPSFQFNKVRTQQATRFLVGSQVFGTGEIAITPRESVTISLEGEDSSDGVPSTAEPGNSLENEPMQIEPSPGILPNQGPSDETLAQGPNHPFIGNPPILPPVLPPSNPIDEEEPLCDRRTPGLLALVAAIKAQRADDQSTIKGELKDCEAGLVRFAAAAVDGSGKVVSSTQISSYDRARVGVFCPNKKGGPDAKIDLLLRYFYARKLRGKGIAATYLCKHNTPAAACAPTSPDFIAGFVYGPRGDEYRISNVPGVKDSVPNLDPSQVVAAILTPGGKRYQDLQACNVSAIWSPLVIEKNRGRGIRTLDPKTTSTYFDLTGTGMKDRISCVKDGAFVTLPDSHGNIININQLFGDNTIGPDGNKSPNGFIALGKHDRKAGLETYGVISAADPVFTRLKLWEDENCDGLAQRNELQPLSHWNISSIVWINAVEMMRVDPYGNETRQRNLVTTQNGGLLRIFDLWFKVQNF